MKILHIASIDSFGAGTAARRLHTGLKFAGIDSKMLVLSRSSSDNDIVQFTQDKSKLRWKWDKLRIMQIDAQANRYKNTRPQVPGEFFSDDRTLYDIEKHPLIKEADIIHLHWIAGMVNYGTFFPGVKGKSIVWTLHDMNPFTGGCHYSADCERYQSGCGACPQLGSTKKGDLSRQIFERKKRAYSKHKLSIVTPSKWMAERAKQSLLFSEYNVAAIPYGVSTQIFAVRDKSKSREALSLPQDKTLILFGAADLSDERKGTACLVEALKQLASEDTLGNCALVVFGKSSENFLNEVGVPFYSLGWIDDEVTLSEIYSAADILVIPSAEDNFPNMILESFACGTPAVGFDVGGIPELIRPNETGLLADKGDVRQLSERIEWMINHPEEREAMGDSARKLIEKECSLEVQSGRCLSLYESILKNK